ncbi:MAG: hypothetical protein EBU84_18150 [Actinobacteria bacterium]|nr:hypothetical protein [Actinomycetota bacterium]
MFNRLLGLVQDLGAGSLRQTILIITSQLPTDNRHDAIVDSTIADALLDRVIHNSHKISLKGESRRKTKGKQLKLVG